MQLNQLILKLDTALVYAKAQDTVAMDAILEDVRDKSYDVTPRQSAFFIRTACAAVEHVASAFDPLASAESAMAAIALAKAGSSDLEDLSAA
jgi:hypothetical protein